MVRQHGRGEPGGDRLAPVTPIRPGAWREGPSEAPRLPEATADEPPAFAEIEEASLKALGRRSLSRRELERALARIGYQQHDIDDELDRLEGVGLIDDFALAQQLVARLQERKGLVGSAIKAELARRVLHPGAIDYAMDLIDTGDELAQARELASVRARQYGRLDDVTIQRRLTAWLMRRGFSSSAVRSAVDAAIAELRTA
ncbi:MAG TPA: regulatory protein RecX [Microbacteriaceae bacterium]|nr:regulatory protein RecX [Microbacteriaceae bacterium]